MTKKKKIIIICISIFLLLVILFFFVCFMRVNPNIYSNEQHIERISKLVEKRYINSNRYTGYEVYPLYDESEKLSYYLIELQPAGFVYVILNKYNPFIQPFGGVGMYTRDEGIRWQRYRLCIDGIEPPPYDGREWLVEEPGENGHIQYPERRWEVNGDGDFIYNDCSPYKAANVENEKIYLLTLLQGGSSYRIPAVKRGNQYLNLVSLQEFTYEKKLSKKIYPYAEIGFICAKEFDL